MRKLDWKNFGAIGKLDRAIMWSMVACVASVACYARAAITIPNTVDVDALGTTILTQSAPYIISVIGIGVFFLFVIAMKRVVFGGGRSLAHRK